MFKLKRSSLQMDSVILLSLFTIFIAVSMLVVVFAANEFRNNTDTIFLGSSNRSISSYLTEKVRHNDSDCCLSLSEIDGVPVLAIRDKETSMEEDFITYIYYKDGWLCELTTKESAIFTLTSGQKILETSDFKMEALNSSLLKITYTDTNGDVHPLYLHALSIS